MAVWLVLVLAVVAAYSVECFLIAARNLFNKMLQPEVI